MNESNSKIVGVISVFAVGVFVGGYAVRQHIKEKIKMLKMSESLSPKLAGEISDWLTNTKDKRTAEQFWGDKAQEFSTELKKRLE